MFAVTRDTALRNMYITAEFVLIIIFIFWAVFKIRNLPVDDLRIFCYNPNNDNLFTVYCQDTVMYKRIFTAMLRDAENAKIQILKELEQGRIPGHLERISNVRDIQRRGSTYTFDCQIEDIDGHTYTKKVKVSKDYPNINELLLQLERKKA